MSLMILKPGILAAAMITVEITAALSITSIHEREFLHTHTPNPNYLRSTLP